MGVSCIVYSIAGKMGLIGEQNVTNHTGGWELIQRHKSNRLHMSTSSRCWTHWMWYGYIPSVNSVHQTLMHGIRRWAEISLLLVRGLRCTMSIMCSSSSTFRCTWRSPCWFTLGKEPFSRRCCCTWVNTRLSGIRCQGYRSRYSSTAAVVLPLQNPYTKCTSA